jgi:hypothetical protein
VPVGGRAVGVTMVRHACTDVDAGERHCWIVSSSLSGM